MDSNESEQASAQANQANLALAALGYLPMLFFLPLLAARDDKVCRFHGYQSLVLFVAFLLFWFAVWVLDLVFGRMMGSIFILGFLFRAIAWLVHNLIGAAVSLAYVAVVIVGLIQAALGRYWRIPVLGVYAERLGPSGPEKTS
jgi:uncharacterized membrane protein